MTRENGPNDIAPGTIVDRYWSSSWLCPTWAVMQTFGVSPLQLVWRSFQRISVRGLLDRCRFRITQLDAGRSSVAHVEKNTTRRVPNRKPAQPSDRVL